MISRFYFLVFLLPVFLNLVEAFTWTSAPSVAIRQEFDIETESLQAMITQHIHKTSNYTDLEDLFVPEAFKLLKLDFNDFSNRQSFERNKAVLDFLNRPNAAFLRTGVEELDVSYFAALADVYLEIEKLLQSLDNVKIIRWKLEEPISPTTLRYLERNNPSAKIYYTVPFEKQRNHVSITEQWSTNFDRRGRCSGPTPSELTALQSIINSTNLHALTAKVTYGAFTNRDRLRLVFEALSTCPNVRELDLSLNKRESPCTAVNGQPDYFNFRNNPDARFPALEILKLRGYNLEAISNAEWDDVMLEEEGDDEEDDFESSQTFRSFRPTAQHRVFLPSRASNIEEWLRAMDWSKLHTLHLEQPYASALQMLKGAVPRLKHIEFIGGSPKDGSASVEFITNTELALETLSLSTMKLRNFDKLVDGIIKKHGDSLKNLKINARHRSRNTRLILNNTAISRLLFACDSLETLDIDMATTAEWDYPLLKELASHPRLRDLTLRLEAKDDKTRSSKDFIFPYTQTLFNGTSAPGLFRYLRRHKIGRPLEKLDLLAFPPDDGTVSSLPKRVDGFILRYRCAVDEAGLELCEEHGLASEMVWTEG